MKKIFLSFIFMFLFLQVFCYAIGTALLTNINSGDTNIFVGDATSAVSTTTLSSTFVLKSGDTMTGDLNISSNGDGAIYFIKDIDASTGTYITSNGNSYFKNSVSLQPSSTQVLYATMTITSNESYDVVVSSGGAVMMSSNPQIIVGAQGQILKIQGSSDTNTITLVDGNGLFLQSNRTLGLNDIIVLSCNGTTGWIEESYSNT